MYFYVFVIEKNTINSKIDNHTFLTHIHTHTHTHTHTYIYIYIYIHPHTHTQRHTHNTLTHTYVCRFVCICVFEWIWKHQNYLPNRKTSYFRISKIYLFVIDFISLYFVFKIYLFILLYSSYFHFLIIKEYNDFDWIRLLCL